MRTSPKHLGMHICRIRRIVQKMVLEARWGVVECVYVSWRQLGPRFGRYGCMNMRLKPADANLKIAEVGQRDV